MGMSFGAHGRMSDINIPTADDAKTPFGHTTCCLMPAFP
jgi:hypothetical protein